MPISGMTGFGRAEGALGGSKGEGWSWAVEARSVNGRNLETRFRGPPGFDGLERATREGAQGRFQRGQLTVGVQAKRSEGSVAVRVNAEQLERYLALGDMVRGRAHGRATAMKARFETGLRGLAGEGVTEERIVPEAAAMAVKADVAEELDRLAGHVEAARALLAADGAVGRRLDFLTQEFMREANTLCSKSQLSALTAVGLDLKAAIEQFREQVQNVE